MVNSKHDFRLVLMLLVEVFTFPLLNFDIIPIFSLNISSCQVKRKLHSKTLSRSLLDSEDSDDEDIKIGFLSMFLFIRLKASCKPKLSFLCCLTEIVTYRSSQLELEKGKQFDNLANPGGGELSQHTNTRRPIQPLKTV